MEAFMSKRAAKQPSKPQGIAKGAFSALKLKTRNERERLKIRLKTATILLNRDELEVIVWLAERMAEGATRYGALDIATDKRDFQKEAGEEAIDGLAYLAMQSIRIKRGTKKVAT